MLSVRLSDTWVDIGSSYRKLLWEIGLAILLFAGFSQFQPFSARTVHAGDLRGAKPISDAGRSIPFLTVTVFRRSSGTLLFA